MKRYDARLLFLLDGGFVKISTMDGAVTREDLQLPWEDEEELCEKIEEAYAEGEDDNTSKEILLTLISAMGQDKIIAFRTVDQV